MIFNDVRGTVHYGNAEKFVTDLLEHKLPVNFKLIYSVVQEVLDMIMQDRELACRINAVGVPLLMKVEDPKDISDILTLAEVIANG